MAFLKIVEFVGEVLIFAINDDFKCTNAVIKIMLCFSYICLPYSVMLCSMYLHISVHVSTFMNEMMIFLCMRKTDGSSVFSLLFICNFTYFVYTIFAVFYFIWDPC